MRYQKSTKIIAWIEMIWATGLLLLRLIGLTLSFNQKHVNLEDQSLGSQITTPGIIFTKAGVIGKIAYVTPCLFYAISEIVLGLYLLKAAKGLNYKKLSNWFIITATYSTAIGITKLSGILICEQINMVAVWIFVGWSFVYLYSLYIVSGLSVEIKSHSLPVIIQQKEQPQQEQKTLFDGGKDDKDCEEGDDGGFNNYIVRRSPPPPAYETAAGKMIDNCVISGRSGDINDQAGFKKRAETKCMDYQNYLLQ